jgi:uncharacterized protein (TIGR00369 family)
MTDDDNKPRITISEFNELTADQLPFMVSMGVVTEEIGYGYARMRLPVENDHLRPGGTVAGPFLMGLADGLMYAVVLGMIGKVELAVTTNLNCNFLRRPKVADIIGEGRILKLGRRLAVGEVSLFSEGDTSPVAHVTATYSIPPDH